MDFSNPITASSIRTVNLKQLHIYCEIKQISMLMPLRIGILDKRERKYKCNIGEFQKASYSPL